MRIKIFISVIFFIFFTSFMLEAQNVIKSNDKISKDSANFNWTRDYTLFDLTTDEPIFPILQNGQFYYKIYYTSKRDLRPYYGEFTVTQLEDLRFFKFKNRETCLKFCLSNNIEDVAVLTTIAADSIKTTTARSGGNITSDGGCTITSRGVVWSTSQNPTIVLSTKTSDGTGTGSFTSNLTGLIANTTYYVRAYATNCSGTAYGSEVSFTTTAATTVPTLTTTAADSIKTTTARSGGNITSDGGCTITASGVVWSTSQNPTIALSTKTSDGTGTGSFTSNLTGLIANTTYYVRAYATNCSGTAYGSEVSFTTTAATTVPTLTTTAADSIKTTAARSGGNITSDGGCTITTSGVVWSTSQNPTIALSTKTSDGTGTGSFTSNLTGLIANTTYYVRAYATNCSGTAYGSEVSFTTTAASQGVPCPGVPTVTDIDGNTYNTVQIGTQCWTKENLRVTKYSDGTIIPLDSSGGTVGNGSGEIWSSRTAGARTIYAHSQPNLATYGYLYNWYAAFDLKGLCPTGWHVPSDSEWIKTENFLGGSIAANNKMKEKGSNYWLGINVDVTNESGFTALPGGYRHPTGSGSAIGFDFLGRRTWYWSSSGYFSLTEGNLGTSLNNNIDGLSFESESIKRLGVSVRCLKDTVSTPSTTVPTLTTTAADSIKTTTARSGGNITSDGGCTITARGVVWSTSQNPTIALSTKTSDGTGTGSFSSNLTGLIANTTYYVRSYATNCVGTAYGSEVSFTTTAASQGVPCPGVPTITDIDGNTYNTVQIGTQCWTKENLKVSKYNDGTSIPTGLDNTTWQNTTSGSYAIYDNDNANNTIYGKLYNWYAVADSRGLCPTGWHVSSDAEWTTLTTYLGGESMAGGKMKSTGTTYWNSPNTNATNESGFTGLPGGYRINITTIGSYQNINNATYFWSATENTLYSDNAWFFTLTVTQSDVVRQYGFKPYGFSVRCLKDTVSTPSTTLPTLTTTAADSIKSTTARSGGNITSDGGCTITSRGVVWSTSQNPTIALSTKSSDGTGMGSFSSNLTGLIANTTYYVRSYATNCVGTAYGSEVSFTTTAASQGVPCPGVPTVTDIDGNTYNTVQIGTQCWTKENLRVTKYSDGTIIPLDNSGGTAGNGAGQTWGSWTTGARTIYEHSVSNLTTYGYLYNWYAAKGIATTGSTSYKNLCPTGWRMPTSADFWTMTGYLGTDASEELMSATGWNAQSNANNNSGFTGLPGGIRFYLDGSYYFRGNNGYWWTSVQNGNDTTTGNGFSLFISNGQGTWNAINSPKRSGYNIRCLKDTVSAPSTTLPTLTTTAADSIKTTTVRSGGNITSDGGCTITARGVVWSTSQNPTIVLSTKSSDGTGMGSFSSNLTGLIANTTYYVRAYATNCAGTAYGTQVTFTTAAATTLPSLTTTAADSIKSTTARSGGNITSDGGCTITSRGVVWSTSQNPTIALSTKSSDGTGTGSFSSNLTGLIANTTYYVRAYATNCSGTAYGTQVSFTTTAASQGVPCPSVPTVTDIDGNTYNTVQIGTQCWTKENLRVTKYSDGTIIPLDNSGGTAGNGAGQTWSSRTVGARTIYAHSQSNLTTYGYLYNWYAAKGIATTGSTSYKNLCPTGWHVPSDGEWTALTTFLGGESIAGGKMKSTGTTLWTSPNTGATNESGFTGLPGGYCNTGGSFSSIRSFAFFWSATESASGYAWLRYLTSSNGNVGRDFNYKSFGASVRCLRD